MLIDKSKIPVNVACITETLDKMGFEAYIVGGCVRDLLIGREPKDWDITTNATPEQIIGLFPKTVYENSFGTVAVVFVRPESDSDTRSERDDVTHETTEDVSCVTSNII